LIELHSVPSQGRIAGYRISEDQSGGNGDHRRGPLRQVQRRLRETLDLRDSDRDSLPRTTALCRH